MNARRRVIDPISHAMELLKCYADTDEQKEKCELLHEAMTRVNADRDAIVRALVGYIFEGLTNGNWPWSVNGKEPLTKITC